MTELELCALDLLSVRPHTGGELARRMRLYSSRVNKKRKGGFDPSVAGSVGAAYLNRMSRKGLVLRGAHGVYQLTELGTYVLFQHLSDSLQPIVGYTDGNKTKTR